MSNQGTDSGFSNAAMTGDNPTGQAHYRAAPQHNEKYGPPSQQYGAPPQQYGAPPQQYGAPPQQYGTPPQQYGAPPQQYGAPSPQYGAPPQQYGAPPPQYGAYPQPQEGYGGAKLAPYVTNQPQQQQSSNIIVTLACAPGVMIHPMRESGPAPTTTCSLVFAILSIFFCIGGCPFAVGSIIYNRKARGQVLMGQPTTATRTVRTAHIFLAVAIVVGIIAWIIFAVRLKAAIDTINAAQTNNYYYRTG